MAFSPHEPAQGSRHLRFIHALSLEQSGWIVHSGLQLGGLPIYSLRQEQADVPPMFRHSECGPQGDGKHGSLGTSTTGSLMTVKQIFSFHCRERCFGRKKTSLTMIKKFFLKVELRKCVARCLTWNSETSCEWISGESVFTNAYRAVIYNVTHCVCSAWIGAGIHTLFFNTC